MPARWWAPAKNGREGLTPLVSKHSPMPRLTEHCLVVFGSCRDKILVKSVSKVPGSIWSRTAQTLFMWSQHTEPVPELPGF